MFFAQCFIAFGQTDILTEISQGIKEANADKISRFFNANIDLTTDNGEEMYSKVQATSVLRDFFVRYPVRSYTTLHKGQKEGAEYVVGTYISTRNTSFRVYYFIKQNGETKLINDLRFEKE